MSTEHTYHGGCCDIEKHPFMRLEYQTAHCSMSTEQWASDKEYIESLIPSIPQPLIDGLVELLDCSLCWIDGNGDGDIVDKDDAVAEWYDTMFRPYLRQMVREDMHKIGLSLNWKAFECYIFEFYTQDDVMHPCGTMAPLTQRIAELQD